MQPRAVIKILGILLALFSMSMLPPIAIDFIYHDQASVPFILSFFVTLISGLALWFSCRQENRELKTRDGFLIVVFFWVILSFFGAIPFVFSHTAHLNFTNAAFEAVSGLTTTGATIFSNIGSLSHAILFYRQELQFLGGMGIVVLALAVLPMLGIGGMQLYRAEVPGPVKNSKLTPRLSDTAKTLWYIYVGLVVICGLAYWGAGMSLFDAIGESFSTVSTGGFAMHTSSFAYYNSSAINIIAIIFMILGSVNFSLHFMAIRNFSLMTYLRETEVKVYLGFLLFLSVVTCFFLVLYNHSSLSFNHVIKDVFDVVSITSTTGLVASQFSQWPNFLPIMMMVAAIIGGCAASTSGGIKIIRIILMFKLSVREIHRLIHPDAVLPVKLNNNILKRPVVEGIWGFVAIYILLFFILLFLLMISGLDFTTAYGALAACLSNAGAGIAQVAYGYAGLHESTKWILIFSMLAGRLEIFSLFAIFMPSFWRY